MSDENGTPPEAAIDSHAEEIAGEPRPLAPPVQALALAARPPAEREVLMPLDPGQVVEGMRQYQQLLRDLLEPSDWQTHDKNGNPLERPFLKKSGWRKIARAFNLSFERVHSHVERDEDGTPVRAEVWIRAVAPNGQYGDGDGYCSADEGRFRSWRGRQKLENDLRATATTRAKNRAIADLVGMGEVSAEEIAPAGEEEEAHAQALAAGARASDELARVAFGALARLLGDGEPDRDAARAVGRRIAQDHGYLPVAVGRALCHAATAIGAGRRDRQPARTGPVTMSGAVPAAAGTPVAPATRGLDYWQKKGRYRDDAVRSLAELVCGENRIERLTPDQAGQVCLLLECAVRGKVGGRSLEA